MNQKLTIWFYMLVMCLFAGPAQAVTFKIATLSPEGSFWMQKMRDGASEVLEKTAHNVEFKFYPGGVMGDDQVVLKKIRLGQLQGGAVVSGSLAGVYPDNQVYNLPVIFKTYEEVDYVRQTMDPVIKRGLEDKGFVILGIAEGGFAYVMSQAPVRTVSDLIKQKMWIPDNDSTSLETVRTFGVSPIPLSIADVRAGLQTGLINTVTTSPIGAIALQWHTQIKYLTETPLLYIYAMLAVDRGAFGKLTPGEQQIVRDVMGRAFNEIDRQNRIDNVKALEVLQNQGVAFIKIPEDVRAEWQAKASEVAKRLIDSGKLSHEIVSQLESLLAAYRKGPQ
jgi:TRAP-type C4-dicarboxylate transport system substrate-binding protein